MDNKREPNESHVFVEPEIQVTIFSDDLILADSDRCCDDHANFVGYT